MVFYMVAMNLIGCYFAFARVFLCYSAWLFGCYIIGYSGWLLGYCYAFYK